MRGNAGEWQPLRVVGKKDNAQGFAKRQFNLRKSVGMVFGRGEGENGGNESTRADICGGA